MKKFLKISLLFLLFVLVNFNLYAQQNMIFNYDFEFYTQCPDNFSQADRCLYFFSLVESPDYANCNFFPYSYYSTDTTAYSGTGFMTMATHNNPDGAAESIAQNLPVELDSGIIYEFTIMAKSSDSGLYANHCGGICLFGFEDYIMGPYLPPACSGTLPGAILLGCSDTISEIDWTLKQFNFITPSKIRAVAFSPACTPNCQQAIFIDSVSIQTAPVGIINYERQLINIFPVPANERLEINFKSNFSEKNIFIYNISGKLIARSKSNLNSIFVEVENFPDGLYFMKIELDNNLINRKFIVQH